MSDTTLLSDLCSICNTNQFKYRCPGCSARTCSLPCYKRHQQWAQCSGQRDPTKFVKKSQLATPAGIDHDFNFLTGIERGIEKAEKTASAAAADSSSGTQPKTRSQLAGNLYGRLEATAGVTIIKAPKGLSRQKENNSHPSSTKRAKKNVVWTVEWLDDSKQRLLTETSSTSSIAEASPFEQHKSKKRKLGAEVAVPTGSSTLQDAKNTSENQDEPLEQELDSDQREQQKPTRRGTPPASQEEISHPPERETHLAAPHNPDPRHDGSSAQPLGNGRYRYFLLKPRTTSNRHVLIPLDSNHALGDCLRGRTILEFPTIYAFPTETEDLPEEFMLDDEYAKQEGEDQREFDEMMRELDPEILRRLKEDGTRNDGAESAHQEVDSKRILDVLKRDLGAAGL